MEVLELYRETVGAKTVLEELAKQRNMVKERKLARVKEHKMRKVGKTLPDMFLLQALTFRLCVVFACFWVAGCFGSADFGPAACG